MNAITLDVPVSAMAKFSSDGRIFRAFGFLLAARHGELLAVQLGRTSGDMRQVVDECPVSWDEVHTMLDRPLDAPRMVTPEDICTKHPRLAMITPYGWQQDGFRFLGSVHDVPRLTHPAGLFYSWVQS